MYLTSQGKLLPVLDDIAAPSATTLSAGKYALAAIVLLFVLTLIPSQDAAMLVGIIVLGGVYYETRTSGGNIITNLQKSFTGSSTPQPTAGT